MEKDQQRHKLLVIDDDKIIRERLKKLLEMDDFEVSIAEDGQRGLDIFKKETPEIVFVDVKMPGMDGIEVLKKIKEESKDTEVIIITGHGGIDTAIEALREDAFSYIEKPIEFDKLKIDIKKALEKQEIQRKLDEHVRNLEEAHRKLKTQQAQIHQAAKLTALGQLGAGVAHEMNQPLMAMSTHMELMLINEVISSHPELKEKLLKIKDQFIRLGSIVKRLSDYSSGRTGSYTDTDINRPINDGYYLFAQQFKDHNIHVTLSLEKDIPQLYIDRYQIQDVVINFLVNARDAVDDIYEQKEGGLIHVISAKAGDENAVFVGVVDNGKKIKEGTETELFDPFFTTKTPGKGTGLGLSVCYTIIRDHRGLIGFSGLENGMKVFYFVLPLEKDKDLVDNSVVINKKALEIFNSAVLKGE
jgi:two-component system NtrC family sensor kinase